jgi:hypothetical protein
MYLKIREMRFNQTQTAIKILTESVSLASKIRYDTFLLIMISINTVPIIKRGNHTKFPASSSP